MDLNIAHYTSGSNSSPEQLVDARSSSVPKWWALDFYAALYFALLSYLQLEFVQSSHVFLCFWRISWPTSTPHIPHISTNSLNINEISAWGTPNPSSGAALFQLLPCHHASSQCLTLHTGQITQGLPSTTGSHTGPSKEVPRHPQWRSPVNLLLSTGSICLK